MVSTAESRHHILKSWQVYKLPLVPTLPRGNAYQRLTASFLETGGIYFNRRVTPLNGLETRRKRIQMFICRGRPCVCPAFHGFAETGLP
ncbi:hypothetical protein ISS30_01965 [bacterium]|nr:hypothetical protein [bacterium]